VKLGKVHCLKLLASGTRVSPYAKTFATIKYRQTVAGMGTKYFGKNNGYFFKAAGGGRSALSSYQCKISH